MLKLLSSLATDERGATAIEYGLIVALISLAMLAGFAQFSEAFLGMMEYIRGIIEESIRE